jgi:hypothetical protein
MRLGRGGCGVGGAVLLVRLGARVADKRVPATAPTAAPTKNPRRDSSCLLMRIASLRYELACSQQEVCARFRFGRQDDGPAVLTYQGGRRGHKWNDKMGIARSTPSYTEAVP